MRKTSAFKISEEQSAIVACRDFPLLVSAGAGTGKTSTLEAFAHERPGRDILYLAFNQAIRSEAQRRFPRNVRCLTTHGLAYPSFGSQFRGKLGNPKPYHVAPVLGVTMIVAGMVLAGIARWLFSPDEDLIPEHFLEADEADRGKLVDLAHHAWRVMSDPDKPAIPMPHDGYLKLFQLSRPSLESDVILFDECQDANAAMLDIIERQQGSQRVYVGDRRQAIYGFRGAVNAMDVIQAQAHLQLTGSYRYGQGIADVANTILSTYSKDALKLRGLAAGRTKFSVERTSAHTILARTNAGLFSAAVGAMEDKLPINFVGGAGSYRFNALLDASRLRHGLHQEIRDPFLRAFDSFGALREYAESVEDGELRSLIYITDRYRDDLPHLVDAITRDAGDQRGITLATAHRAKGLEWRAVRLWDDFTDMRPAVTKDGPLVQPDSEEINLLYVAVTRAKERIALHAPLLSWLSERDPALHDAIVNEHHAPSLPPRIVSGLDFSAPSFAPGDLLDERMRSILRDAPAMIAGSVAKCDPATHHLLKLVFDMTFHLATGKLLLSGKEASPAPAQAFEPQGDQVVAPPPPKKRVSAVPLPISDVSQMARLWMSGESLENISERIALPVDKVVRTLAHSLGIQIDEIRVQNARRAP